MFLTTDGNPWLIEKMNEILAVFLPARSKNCDKINRDGL